MSRSLVALALLAAPCSAQDPVFKLRAELGGGDLGGAHLSAYAPDGKTLYVAAGGMHPGEVYVVDLAAEKRVGVLRAESGPKAMPRYPTSMAISPDGKWLAVAHQLIESDRAAQPKETGWDLQLWDTAARKIAARKIGDRWELHHLVFSADGKSLAGNTAGYAKETDWYKSVARVWAVPDLAEKHSLEARGHGFQAVAFAGGELRAFHAGQLLRWDLGTGKPLDTRTLTDRGMFATGSAAAFSPDGKRLAVAKAVSKSGGVDTGAELSVFDADAGGKARAVARGHTRYADRVAFSPDGSAIVTTSPDQTTIVWDADNLAIGVTIPSFGHVAFTPDSKRIALGGTGVWGTDGRHWYTLGRHGTQVWAVAFHPKSWGLMSGQNAPVVRFWTVNTRRNDETFALDPNQRTIRALAYSPSGFYVAVGEGAKVKVVRSQWVHQTLTDHTSGVNAVAFSPCGKYMASASGSVAFKFDEAKAEPGEVIVWRWDGDKATKLHTLKAHPSGTFALAFSPDGKTLATAGGDPRGPVGGDEDKQPLRLWDTETGKPTAAFPCDPRHQVNAVALSPDGKTLAHTGLDGGGVRLLDLATGKERVRLHTHTNALAFTPDGKAVIAVGSGGRGNAEGLIEVWDAATGKKLASEVGHPARINAVAVSPDGKLFATGCDNGILNLWDLRQP